MQKAYFAAGCFWGVEAAFREYLNKGVVETSVGYMGGDTEGPTYKAVCSGKTGHAETAQIVFDPGQISYEQLLDVFWQCHNPTSLNKQGVDIGTQYRSSIFYSIDEQNELAKQSKEKEQEKHKNSVVTEITQAEQFYIAEDYHQQYFEKNPNAACQL